MFTAVAEEGGLLVTIHFYQSVEAASELKRSTVTVAFGILLKLPGPERGLSPIRPHPRLQPQPEPHCLSSGGQHCPQRLSFLLVLHSGQVCVLFLAVRLSVEPSHGGATDQHEAPKDIRFRRCKGHELCRACYQTKKISSIANLSVCWNGIFCTCRPVFQSCQF